MIKKIISWLETHPLVNLIILISYFFSVVLPHEWLGAHINSIFRPLGRNRYNLIILILAIAAILVVAWLIRIRWRQYPLKKHVLPYILGSIVLLVISYKILIVINIEFIHFVQYALFAILAYPLLKNILSVMFLATAFGALDELYQYVVLTPHINKYFDFNDVFINQIGAGIGCLLVVIMGFKDTPLKISKLYRDPGFLSLAILIIIFLAGWLSGYYTLFDPDAISRFTLIKEQAESYWVYPKGPYAVFHRLNIREAVICLITAILLYGSMTRINKN